MLAAAHTRFCHFCLIVYFDPIDCRTDSRRESAFLQPRKAGVLALKEDQV